MWSQLRILSGAIFLLCLELVLGNAGRACNCSCSLQPDGGDICEFIQTMNEKMDIIEFYQAIFRDNFTEKSELDDIMFKYIKSFVDTYVCTKAQKEEKTEVHDKHPNKNLHFQQSEESFDFEIPNNPSYDTEEETNEQGEIKRKSEEIDKLLEEIREIYLNISRANEQFHDKIMAEKSAEKKFKTEAQEKNPNKNLNFEQSEESSINRTVLESPNNSSDDAEEENNVQREIERKIKFEKFPEKLGVIKYKINLANELCNDKTVAEKRAQGKLEIWNSETISYKELEDLNATCPSLDSCENDRDSDSLTRYNCQCGRLCSTFDTCCLDSPFLGLPRDGPFQSCQTVYGIPGLAYFMVDECPRNGTAGKTWQSLCAHGEEHNFMTYVPVTSTITKLTYKNFYCFACHENHEDYNFWEVYVYSKKKIATFDNGSPILVFDSIKKEWTGEAPDGSYTENVLFIINGPSELQVILTECRDGVISKCRDDWTNDIIENKCIAYTAMIAVHDGSSRDVYRLYKNPHCAVCNYERLNDTSCLYNPTVKYPYIPIPTKPHYDDGGRIIKKTFSNTQMFALTACPCPEETIWNPYSRVCSPLVCTENYTLVNGKCISSGNFTE